MLLKCLLVVVSATLCFAGIPIVIGKARPCDLKDYNCIRRNLRANSHCKLSTRAIPTTYTVARQRLEAPYFNATYIDHNLKVTGQQKCFVSEFYYNVNSDTLVIGIDCPYLNFVSDRVMMQHCPLEEDRIFRYKIDSTYPLVRLTMNICGADKLNICNEFTSAFIAQLPRFNVDPKDKPTRNFLSRDLTQLNIFERETFLYRANMLARKFINTRLCDFGCY